MGRMRSLAVFVAVVASVPLAGASPDTIIPKPKQIKLGAQMVSLAGAAIVLSANETKLQIAAAEINARIADLGGKPLPVQAGADAIGDNAIVIMHAGADAGRALIKRFGLGVSATDPGEQGYVIRFVDRGANICLAGSDAQGALYAAVTFRHLLAKRGHGIVAQEAQVKDWPDFKLRQIGVPFAIPYRRPWYDLKYAMSKRDAKAIKKAEEAYFQTNRRYIDWLLRHKSNFMDPQPASWAANPKTLTKELRTAIRRVNQYALDRGIGTFYYENISVGRYPRDKDNPEFKDILCNKGHRSYFCWSRLDLHHKKARAIAEVMRDCAYTGFFVHDVDGGGWKDPAMWSRRCKRCRKMYGDDHVKADLAVFGTYYDEIKRLVPNVTFVAVIYPYTPYYLNADWIEGKMRKETGDAPGLRKRAEAVAAKLRDFLRRIGQGLPKDIHICVRENTRPNINLMRSVYGKRPFQLYYEYCYWKGWRPWFIMTPRWSKTFLYKGIDDILYGNNTLYNYNPLEQMYGMECAWNTEGPGREYFPSADAWKDPNMCLEPRDVAQAFLERACRDFWGDEAGPFLVPLFMGNLSLYFVRNPDKVARKCGLSDVPQLMAKQAQAAAIALKSLDALWQKVQQARSQGRQIMGRRAMTYFVDYYQFALGVRIVAGYKSRKLGAREAVISGDLDKANREIAAMRSQLDQDAKDLATLRAALKGLPTFAPNYRKRDPFGAMFKLDVAELQADLERFDSERQQLFESFNIPRWFRKIAKSRRFEAAPTVEPIKIDGKLDEPAWRGAPVIEHFTDYRVLRLGTLETQCRVLYDAENIYVGFDCADPHAQDLNIPKRDRDDYQLVDSVEVFLDPGRTRKSFFHWAIDAGGNLFDAVQRPGDDGLPKYSRSFQSQCQFAVARGSDRWSVEIAIPVAELGVEPRAGRAWGFNACRNIVHTHPENEHESVAAGFLDGGDFHSVERFPMLVFAPKPVAEQAPEVMLRVRKPVFKHVTTGQGQASAIAFDAILDTTRTLHDVNVAADVFVGERRVGGFTVMESPTVQLMWRSLRPVKFAVDEVAPGLEVQFAVSAREGRWRFRHVFGSPPKRKAAAAKFVPGVAGQALASPANVLAFHDQAGQRVCHIRPEEGTIDFWVRPNWDGAAKTWRLRYVRHMLLDIGPVRYEYPYHINTRSIAIYDAAGGALCFSITNRSYKSRSVSASIKHWKAGQWRHVACQWRIADGKAKLEMFFDGKKVSGPTYGSKIGRFVKKAETLPIQIGAMNTGVVPADAAIDELRISTRRRWTDDFTPAKRAEVDDTTAVIFHFDGDLRGHCGDGATVEAAPGSAG